MTRIFPSALRSEQASGAIRVTRRREPTAADRAMWPSDKLKSYYEQRGEWSMSAEAREELFPFLTQPTGRHP